MNITKKQIKDLKPCPEGWEWFVKNGKESEDLKTLLMRINNERPDWARWLFTNLMDKKQCVEISVFAARKVLHINEEKYNSKAPIEAIEAAEKWIKEPTEENRADAAAAAYAAADADDAADAAYAYAYAYAADAAADDDDAAADDDAAYVAAKKDFHELIIVNAVRILEKK